jgi:F0F1-type ATP synthase membrane subunit b/b'
MRPAALALAFGLSLASYVLPQEPGGAKQTQEAEQGDPWIWWKWANFLILIGGIGYLAAKHLPPVFQARSDEIQGALAEAAKLRQAAESQASSIEQRLKNLQIEIEDLRENARTEAAAEGERIRQETERHLARIQEQSVQEIVLMTRAARHELRRYSADLAVSLAAQRIHARMTPETKQNLLDGFLNDLRSRTPAVTRT